VRRIWQISALFAWKGPKLGDDDSGGVFANHETHARKHERKVVWRGLDLENREPSPLLSRTW
jgi:hypothetical protein